MFGLKKPAPKLEPVALANGSNENVNNNPVAPANEQAVGQAVKPRPKYGAMLADYPGYDPFKEIEERKVARKKKLEERAKKLKQIIKDREKAEIEREKEALKK